MTTELTAPARAQVSVKSWRANQNGPSYIAHRGSGDVYPEHSMAAYEAAVSWGATCMEISVAITSDDVLICMHDGSYDRTTNGSGPIREQPSSVLETLRIVQPQLGAAWTRDPPPVPLFEDVLRRFGGTVILCVEAKVPGAYKPMMAMVEKFGLRDSVIVKAHYRNKNVRRAQKAGYPVFGYFGGVQELSKKRIRKLGARLRPESDFLVLVGVDTTDLRFPYIRNKFVRAAVATGVPVWVHPLHRRSDAEHFFAMGVQGAICASFGYIAGTIPPATHDTWAGQAIAPGQVSRSPAHQKYAPELTEEGAAVLAAVDIQHFLTLGDVSPVPAAAGSYSIGVDACWLAEPDAAGDHLSIVFAHGDDRYYQHGLGVGTGYNVVWRRNGELALHLHLDGLEPDRELATVQTPPLELGRWSELRVDVTPSEITVTRTDVGISISFRDSSTRGGYVHLGRASTTGVAAFRRLRVS